MASIEISCEDGIGVMTICNEARRNALSLKMWQEIPPALIELSQRKLRVLIVRGAGSQAFSAGADISEFDEIRRDAATGRAYEAQNAAAFKALRLAPFPTLAAISGFCMGGGVGLAAACDLRLGAESALFCLPPAKLGLAYPPDAVGDIVRLIGAAHAKHLFFTARRFHGAEAKSMGFLNHLVEGEDLFEEATELAQSIAENAPLSHIASKLAVNHAAGVSGLSVDDTISAADACFNSEDFAEGRTAFKDRRKPKFQGK